MKIQFLVLIFSVYLVLSTEACNTAADRQVCANLNQRCRATAANRPPSTPTDSVGAFNTQCRAQVGATWRNVAVCDLLRASCEITLVACQNINCRNVQARI